LTRTDQKNVNANDLDVLKIADFAQEGTSGYDSKPDSETPDYAAENADYFVAEKLITLGD
jgi:hypothetical protein